MIGIGPPLENAKSGFLYEFIAQGRDQPGNLGRMMDVLNRHRVKAYVAGGYNIPEPGIFAWSGFADYSASQFKIDDTIEELKKLDFVLRCDAVKVTDVVFDKFLFPNMIFGKARVIIVRAEPFIGIERRLIAAFGTGGASIMFDEGRQYCIEAFEQYVKMLPGASPEVIMRNAIAGFRTTGWGLFEFDLSKLLIHGYATVTIREPPFSGVPGLKESFFTNGLACGAIEAIFNAKVGVETSKYDEKSRTLHLSLRSLNPK